VGHEPAKSRGGFAEQAGAVDRARLLFAVEAGGERGAELSPAGPATRSDPREVAPRDLLPERLAEAVLPQLPVPVREPPSLEVEGRSVGKAPDAGVLQIQKRWHRGWRTLAPGTCRSCSSYSVHPTGRRARIGRPATQCRPERGSRIRAPSAGSRRRWASATQATTTGFRGCTTSRSGQDGSAPVPRRDRRRAAAPRPPRSALLLGHRARLRLAGRVC
jgi:hypothetical protein